MYNATKKKTRVAGQGTFSGGEAEFWNGEFFFFSPGNTDFFCFLRNGTGNFVCLIGIQNFVI